MIHFMLDKLHSLHLTPTGVGLGSLLHARGESCGSASRPLGLAPVKVLLVAIKDLVGTSLREFSKVVKRKLRHGGKVDGF